MPWVTLVAVVTVLAPAPNSCVWVSPVEIEDTIESGMESMWAALYTTWTLGTPGLTLG